MLLHLLVLKVPYKQQKFVEHNIEPIIETKSMILNIHIDQNIERTSFLAVKIFSKMSAKLNYA